MAKKAATVKGGAQCPACKRGTLEAVPVPTPEEFARAYDRENPQALPAGHDTASPTQREQLGPLSECDRCGYRHRDAPGDNAAQ